MICMSTLSPIRQKIQLRAITDQVNGIPPAGRMLTTGHWSMAIERFAGISGHSPLL